jgi:hypothetical protein
MLLEKHAYYTFRDKAGRSALDWGVEKRRRSIVRVLRKR